MTLPSIRASRKRLVDVVDDVGEVLVAARGAPLDQADDLFVDLRVEGGEREVFQLPLDRVHAQPVRQRGVDLEGLACLRLLLGLGQELQGAHVVQPVAELDDQHPDVASHGHDHLAGGLGLGRLTVLDLVELGDAVDEQRDLVAEVVAQLIE